METIDIAPVRPEDVDTILAIQTECGLSEWTRQGYLDEITRTDSLLIAAWAGEQIVGFLVARAPFASAGEPSHSDLYNIGTRAAFRRSGVGSRLLNALINTCDERGIKAIWLDVRSSNDAAKAFYKRYGFVKTGTRPGFYSRPSEDADVMCRTNRTARSAQSNQDA